MRVKYSSSPPALKSLNTLFLSNKNLKLKFVKFEIYFMFNNLCKRKTLINKQLTLLNKQQLTLNVPNNFTILSYWKGCDDAIAVSACDKLKIIKEKIQFSKKKHLNNYLQKNINIWNPTYRGKQYNQISQFLRSN